MACKSTEPSTLSIPDKTFLLKPVDFNGPCTPVNINVHISGKLIAPSDMSEWKDSNYWISFHSINGLKITGSGTAEINGRGKRCTSGYGVGAANNGGAANSGYGVGLQPGLRKEEE
ncbi:hypothetical protein NE237_023881 [Protea cynaroides]|uniref:Uncharacterized protein n=1 Tax=Protea cynaroides TaxID=273540 RepID=A0A9Q0HH36_9MAGN|nr:hypothetical protein NE237_023881 [Protea cynaroides]